MKKSLLVAGLTLLYACGTLAQISKPVVITPGTAEEAGVLPDRLKRIDALLEDYTKKQWTNGVVALFIHDGKIAYYKSFGYDDLSSKKTLPKDGIFRIASQTKAITSVAIMILYEEGKMMLDDPISWYIPEFKNPRVLDTYNEKDTTYTTVPAKREITIRDLLTHTSGIEYAQIGSPKANAIYFKNGITSGIGLDGRLLATDMKKLGSMPLFHQPGEKFTYGLNVDLLGYLVEVLSGMSLDEFFHKRIFEPLGMKDTYFYLPADKRNRLVNLYVPDSTGKLNMADEIITHNGRVIRDYPKLKGTYYSGGGGLSSTIMDYAIFLQMLLNNGEYNGVRILSRNSVRMMTTNQIGDVDFGPYKFGLGFQLVTNKSSGIKPLNEGSFSWGGAFSTTYWVDPKEKIVGLIYKQLWGDQHGELANKYQVSVYQALAK